MVYLSAGADGQLVIETRTEFEAGVGTMSVWVEVGDARAEFVNYETLYLGERSAAWIGELRAARDGTSRPQEAPAAAESVWGAASGQVDASGAGISLRAVERRRRERSACRHFAAARRRGDLDMRIALTGGTLSDCFLLC